MEPSGMEIADSIHHAEVKGKHGLLQVEASKFSSYFVDELVLTFQPVSRTLTGAL